MRINFKGFKDKSLCDTCDYGQVMTTSRNARYVICNSWGKRVPPNVMECSSYCPKGALNEHSMTRIAWVLNTDKGKIVGFTPPKQRNSED